MKLYSGFTKTANAKILVDKVREETPSRGAIIPPQFSQQFSILCHLGRNFQ